jgi:hypothetical protein
MELGLIDRNVMYIIASFLDKEHIIKLYGVSNICKEVAGNVLRDALDYRLNTFTMEKYEKSSSTSPYMNYYNTGESYTPKYGDVVDKSIAENKYDTISF